VPITVIQVTVGALALMFGMRWLRKAILRSAGIIGLHDEDAIFKKQLAKLADIPNAQNSTLDKIAAATAFNAVVLEGLEVVFIVLATGATGQTLGPAIAGAALAGIIVIGIGIAVHRPLTKVPENTMKFVVGVMLSAYGVFWFGEGLHLSWPGGDLSVLGLIASFMIAAVITVWVARMSAGQREPV
jgi:uncharacterized membrane protein